MLLNIILSDFQHYRTLLAKVIQFFVSPEKCENQGYKFLTPDRRYAFVEKQTNKFDNTLLKLVFVCLFDLILYVPSTIFQLNKDWSFW